MNPRPRPIFVLLADDQALVRNMLRHHLDRELDIAVVAAVDNAGDAVGEAVRVDPDVVILDIDMPGMSCFEAARMIQTQCPRVRTLFLSSFANDTYIDQALSVEAAGYLTKDEPPDSVVAAIRAVQAGQRYFSAGVEERIVVEQDGLHLAQVKRSRASTLSDRELEILRYIARGLSQKEIAEVTHRSSQTVHKHCNNIMAKLDIHDRVKLACFAIREGLAEP